MRVSEVTNIDGQMCIQLINLLRIGRWELSGPDIAAHADTVRWVQALGNLLGEDLRPASKPAAPVPSTDQTMKIKGMGPIGGSTKRKKK